MAFNKLSTNLIMNAGSKLVYVPSGSNSSGGSAISATTASYNITMSGFSATGSNLNRGAGSGSYFLYKSIGTDYTYKFFYTNDTSTVEPTASNMPSIGHSNASSSAVRIALKDSDTGSAIVAKTVHAFNNVRWQERQNAILKQSGSVFTIHSTMPGISTTTTGPYTASAIAASTEGFMSHSITMWADKSADRNTWVLQTISGSGHLNQRPNHGSPNIASSSFSMGLESQGSKSYMISSSNHIMYVSSSGKMGFNTTNPKNNFDIKVDDLKFRSDDGKSEAQFTNGKMTFKKFATTASGHSGEIPTEVSGAEVVIGYTPGYYSGEQIARAGDVLGGITWEDLAVSTGSGTRDNAIAMRIRGVVDSVSNDGSSSIAGRLEIGMGSREPDIDISTLTSFREGQALFHGQLAMSGSNNIYMGNSDDIADRDRRMVFWNGTAGKRYAVGVDESRNRFVIHGGNTAFPSSDEDFYVKGTEIGTANNLIVGGSTTLGNADTTTHTITGHVTASGNISSSQGFIGPLTGNASTATKITSITNTNIVQLGIDQILTNKTLTQPTIGDMSRCTFPTLNQATTGNAATSTKIASITNADIVQKTSTQTLTNKTLTSPTLTAPVLGTPSSGNLASCTFGDLTISFADGRISFSADGYTTHTITMEERR